MTGDSVVAQQSGTKVRVASLAELKAKGCLVRPAGGHSLALFLYEGKVYALDNRCPHMGFPLDRGTLCDGVLTCHWHHARFDLATGGTFDQWADEARTFPVEVVDGDICVDVTPMGDTHAHQRSRLRDGLERNIPLVIAKVTLSLVAAGGDAAEPFRAGLEFGVGHRHAGWGQGLTMHACFMNVLPHLDGADRPRALYHGLAAVAWESRGAAPRFPIRPLPGAAHDLITLKRWFRQFVEVRDAEGAERCIASAVAAGAGPAEMTDILFAAATDHRYIQTGHVADFTNKALEALDVAGWSSAGPVLASLASAYAGAERMEESNAWRSPVDLVALLEGAFEEIPLALAAGLRRRAAGGVPPGWRSLVPILLGDDPRASVDALLAALRDGTDEAELAGAVVYTSALRIAQFHTGNEFDDWLTAMHSFSFANAIHQAIGRLPSPELVRGVFDAAMSVYLTRFLNVPAARLPERGEPVGRRDTLLEEFIALLNSRHSMNRAGELVLSYLAAGGPPDRLRAAIGHALVREDRDFHSIQMIEAAFRQEERLRGTLEGSHVLVAAARYLAAHSPTVRAQEQTYQVAARLHAGERVFEEPPAMGRRGASRRCQMVRMLAVIGIVAASLNITPAAQREPPPWDRTNPIGPLPSPPLGIDSTLTELNDPPTPARVRLGRWLFFDKRLSADGTIACATCHRPEHAFSEPTPVSTGIKGQKGGRKAPSFINQAWTLYPHFFWDGRAGSLEEQALGPIANPIEMGNTHEAMVAALRRTREYAPYFREAFGTPEITQERVAKAIADYERTRMSGNSPWDRWRKNRDEGAVSADVKKGHELFFGKARCHQCHVGQNFTDSLFHNIGVGWNPTTNRFADDGRYLVTKRASDRGAFKTPTLRDVTLHAPYMHDGSITTLRQVVELYDRGGVKNPHLDPKLQPLTLAKDEIDALVTFMEALTGEGGDHSAPAAFPGIR